jgi:plastocyanin
MKLNSWLFTSTAVIAAAHLASAGDITGKITMKGTPSPEVEIKDVVSDPNCGKIHKEPIHTRFFVTDGKGGLGDVFVYLKDAKTAPAMGAPMLDQVGCEYQPAVVGVQVGQPLKVRNSDPFMHNVHLMPLQNKEKNKAQVVQGSSDDYTFDKAEVLIKVKCDVHPWMLAYVGVVDHPYFAVSAKDGSYTIKNVPAGKYTIEAFHRKSHMAAGKGVSQDVTVDASGGKADFTVEVK